MTVSFLDACNRFVILSDSEESLTHRILLSTANRHILRRKDSSAPPQNNRVIYYNPILRMNFRACRCDVRRKSSYTKDSVGCLEIPFASAAAALHRIEANQAAAEDLTSL